MTRMKRRGIIMACVTLMVSFITLCVVNVVYTTHEVNETKRELREEQVKNQRKICGVLNVSKKPRPIPPVASEDVKPITEYGKKLEKYNQELDKFNEEAKAEVVKLTSDIGCPPVTPPL